MTGDVLFWAIAGLLALAVAALLIGATRRGRAEGTSAAASDIAVYKEQLAEIDRDLARGILSEDEAKGVRLEVSRRLLAADAAAREGKSAEARSGGVWAAVIVALAVAASGWVYFQVGAPGYQDLPLAERLARANELRLNRPSQAEVEARIPPLPTPEVDPRLPALVAELRERLVDRPDDLQGHVLLARNEAALGNLAAAYAAQERVTALRGTSTDFADLADLMILAAGGYVSPEAEQVLAEVLARDPRNGAARYYLGLLAVQTGRADQAFALWRPLLEESPPDAPWVGPIRAQLPEIASLAGVRYQLPPLVTGPGPTEDDIAAAMEMAPEDRQAMIEGMVASLAGRLANEGGPPSDWARLIGALGVLGQTDRARAIADEAEIVFAGNQDALDQIAAARRQAGIGQ